jgi:hypothetical protein
VGGGGDRTQEKAVYFQTACTLMGDLGSGACFPPSMACDTFSLLVHLRRLCYYYNNNNNNTTTSGYHSTHPISPSCSKPVHTGSRTEEAGSVELG